jgi:hypothetical protein
MEKPHKRNNKLAFIATILLFIAIPISVIGTQSVNDIRNRASETDLYFATEFDEEFSTAFNGIPYERKIRLSGTKTQYSQIHLGCNVNLCGEKCSNLSHNPPEDLYFKETANTLIWPNPSPKNNRTKWPVVISAYTQATDEPTCITRQFSLEVKSDHANVNPECELYNSPSQLNNMPQNRKADFILKAIDPDDGIEHINFSIKKGKEEVFTEQWEIDSEKIVIINKDSNPALSYEFKELGSFTAEAEVRDSAGNSVTCSNQSNSEINIVIPGENGSPEFKTDPYADSNTSLKEGEQYSYTLEAGDPNEDEIDYFIINETGWVNSNIEQSSDGKFKAVFSGTPSQPGSYTLAVALNDGFHNHYSTQIWVINVDSKTNDTPDISVVKPEKGESFLSGDNIYIEWEGQDNNLIENFDIYISSDPTDESTWELINTGVGYNYNSYIWDSSAKSPGTYYIIVEGTDNQSPPATGQGVSEYFYITTPTQPQPQEPEPDEPDIPENYPRILNVKPADKSEITENKPLISADLTASENNQIKDGSVSVKLDDNNITDRADIRGTGEDEGSVLFTPREPLGEGSHKVSISFRDTSDKVAQKSWNFTIEKEQQDEPDEPDEDVISIFGFKLPRRVAMVIGIGLVLLVLALIIPWLFYAAWKRSAQDDDDLYIDTTSPEPPTDGYMQNTPPQAPSPYPPAANQPSPRPLAQKSTQSTHQANSPAPQATTNYDTDTDNADLNSGNTSKPEKTKINSPQTAYNYDQSQEYTVPQIDTQIPQDKTQVQQTDTQTHQVSSQASQNDTAPQDDTQNAIQQFSTQSQTPSAQTSSLNKDTSSDDKDVTDQESQGKRNGPQRFNPEETVELNPANKKDSTDDKQDEDNQSDTDDNKRANKERKNPKLKDETRIKASTTSPNSNNNQNTQANATENKNKGGGKESEEDDDIDKTVVDAFQAISPGVEEQLSSTDNTQKSSNQVDNVRPTPPPSPKPDLSPDDIKINNGKKSSDEDDDESSSRINRTPPSIVPPTKPPDDP